MVVLDSSNLLAITDRILLTGTDLDFKGEVTTLVGVEEGIEVGGGGSVTLDESVKETSAR